MSAPALRSRSHRGGKAGAGAEGPDAPVSLCDAAAAAPGSYKDPSAPGLIEWALYYLIPGLVSLGLRWIYLANKAVSAAISSSGTVESSLVLRWLVHPLAAALAALSPRKPPPGLPHVDAMGELNP
jgi:hypothetical protein